MEFPRRFLDPFRRLLPRLFKERKEAAASGSKNLLQALSDERWMWRMGLDREFIDDVAAEIVLQLVVDGDIVVSPVSVAAVEREVAVVMFQFQALLGNISGSRPMCAVVPPSVSGRPSPTDGLR